MRSPLANPQRRPGVFLQRVAPSDHPGGRSVRPGHRTRAASGRHRWPWRPDSLTARRTAPLHGSDARAAPATPPANAGQACGAVGGLALVPPPSALGASARGRRSGCPTARDGSLPGGATIARLYGRRAVVTPLLPDRLSIWRLGARLTCAAVTRRLRE